MHKHNNYILCLNIVCLYVFLPCLNDVLSLCMALSADAALLHKCILCLLYKHNTTCMHHCTIMVVHELHKQTLSCRKQFVLICTRNLRAHRNEANTSRASFDVNVTIAYDIRHPTICHMNSMLYYQSVN